jgi:hypothetical protein
MSVIIIWICPPSRSLIASGLLLYGTCSRVDARHLLEQLAGDARARAAAAEADLPGCAFASAMNSPTVFACTEVRRS